MDAPIEKFKLPPFEEFSANTKLLPSDYKRLLFIPPTFEAMCKSIEESSKSYKGKRNEQLQFFTQLICKLLEDKRLKPKGDGKPESEYQEKAVRIVGGALYYVTWKIKNPDSVSGVANLFFKMAVSLVMEVEEDCRLEKEVIYPALFINPDEIDPLTIVSWCDAFRTYMNTKNEYKKYPYCVKEKKLFDNLEDIKKKYSPGSSQIENRFSQLAFLGKIAEELLSIQKKLSDIINDLDELPRTVAMLTEQLAEKKTPPHLVEILIFAVKRPEISQYWNTEIIASQLQSWIKLLCSYALYGAYYVLYEKNWQDENFQKTLLKGLNFGSESIMDKEESQFALLVLLNVYLKFEVHEHQIDWKLYNPKGKVDDFQKDCEAVQMRLSKPVQSAVSDSAPTFS